MILKQKLEKFRMSKINTKIGKTKAILYKWYDSNNDPVAKFRVFDWWDGKYIEDLLVYNKYRGMGYSYDLLDYATKTLKCNALSVEKTNKIAKHVYDKYGFKVVDEDDKYYYMHLK